ncbi:Vacuolar protein sorting-associated protein 53 A (AtVPS53) (Protein HEAT-INTOLERANT 1) [Durusdinium trenchii]|uniref:Vacuolar protein sorting-associated protein 53 A (AtVPS53) (Protein HEAT-INTOLERANT 1) n=1 Tax=Durusdinium trenchii TaxID=1381693 RepID=A0ABP0RF30_9DINO
MDDDLEDDFEPLASEEPDPLDAENFNAIDYINKQFPNEDSLGRLGNFIEQLKVQEREIEEGIKNAVRRQAAFGRRAKADLGDAKLAVRELFERIKAIKAKAEQSEELVSDVCRDIKSLHVAKRNLTLTVTALKRLVMLVTALEQLRSTAECRHYEQASSLIHAVEELSGHFQELSHVARVADLLERKAAVFSDLKQQVLEDYMCLHGGIGSATRLEQLPEGWGTAAAKCVDAIGPGMRREVVTQFCLRLLEGYKDIFQPPKEASGLETAERRFAWLKRTLREYDDKYKSQFPESWQVPCGLCDLFCHVTRQHLVEILDTTHHMVDPELMVRVLLKSIEFENELARKWAVEIEDSEHFDTSRLSAMPILKYPDVLSVKAGGKASGSAESNENSTDQFAPRFRGIISECFDAYLGTWVRHEEKQLLEVLQALTAADKMVGQEENDEDEDEVLQQRFLYKSAPELFAAMRGSMQECARFSTHNTLFDIFQVFRKVMNQYASKLSSILPPPGHKLSLDAEGVQAICCVIGTAEYCDETLPLLEESLTKIISADFQDRIGFHDEQELLRNVVNRANEGLVQSVACSLDEAFSSMSRTNWAAFSQDVGDHSAFVGDISERLPKQFEPIAAHLSKIHYRFFCDKFVQSFVARFVAEVHKCRKISERGAQQLLLDTALIKTTLLEAPVVAGHGRQMPTAYSNYVLREMGKAEIMLKVLSSPDVDATSITAMLGDGDDPMVQQLLALRASGDSSDATSAGSMEQQLRHEADRIAAAAGVPSIGSTMNYLGDALNKGAKASEDLKKISGDVKKNIQKLGFPSSLNFGIKKTGPPG